MTNHEILKRVEALRAKRSAFASVWQDVNRYILPLSGGDFFAYMQDEGSKNWDTRQIWDSTAPIGAQRLASYVWASLLSPTFQWLDVISSDAGLNQDPNAKRWFEDTTSRMYGSVGASNFALEMASVLLTLVGLGNGCITQDYVGKGFEFQGVPLEEFVFEEDHLGRVLRWYRDIAWTPAQIISKCTDPATGEVKGVPEKVMKLAESEPDVKLGVVFAIYPRPGRKPMGFDEKVRAPTERPFGFKYVLKDGGETIGEEGGYYEMPAYFACWERAVGSSWGFGPGVLALPTVKLLNALQEAIVNAAAKAVDPVTLVTERGLLSDVDHTPGGLVTVRSLDDIGTLESKARFDVSEDLLARHQFMVRKFFREDDIQLKDSPAMTATEAQLRVELLNRLFGSPIARIHNGIFDPMVQTTFSTMFREGQIEKPPDVVLEAVAKKGVTLKIEYRGAFARAMRSDEVAAVERLATSVAAMGKMDLRGAMDVFNEVEAVRELATKLGVSAKVVRTPDEVQKLRENRERLQQAAAVAEIAKTSAEAMRAEAGAREMGNGA